MMEVILNKHIRFGFTHPIKKNDLKQVINEKLGLSDQDFYLLYNGKHLNEDETITKGNVYIVFKSVGGKGGFGSMLRAIGAQIEKTTNKEACRDLSGRRLRDINEEQRLKNWIATQAEREKEAAARKQKKLDRLCYQPKHEFKDDEYDKERSELTEKVEDAVLQGLEASCSKRPGEEAKAENPKKKRKLWVDSDIDDLSSSEDDEDEKITSVASKFEQITSESSVRTVSVGLANNV